MVENLQVHHKDWISSQIPQKPNNDGHDATRSLLWWISRENLLTLMLDEGVESDAIKRGKLDTKMAKAEFMDRRLNRKSQARDWISSIPLT